MKKFALPMAVIGVCLAVGLLLFSTGGYAQEPLKFSGLLCDTPEQIRAVMVPVDNVVALHEVNKDEPVCGRLHYLAVRGDTVDSYMTPKGPAETSEVFVLGLFPDGVNLISFEQPVLQYAPFLMMSKTNA